MGTVGLLAACRGDEEEALEICRWVEALDRPYLWGSHTGWRSLIAGAPGDGDNAVALRRQTVSEGFGCVGPLWCGWIAFEPLRDYSPWQEAAKLRNGPPRIRHRQSI